MGPIIGNSRAASTGPAATIFTHPHIFIVASSDPYIPRLSYFRWDTTKVVFSSDALPDVSVHLIVTT
jgi:hypothetical protein